MRAFSPYMPPARRPTSITPPWTPASLGSNLLQWLGESYAAAPVDGLQVIESLETEHGPNPATIETPCVTFSATSYAIGDTTLDLTGSWTITLRFKLANATDPTDLFGCGDCFFANGIGVLSVSGGITYIGNGYTAGTGVGSTLIADTWYELAVVKSGTTLTFYLDGISFGTVTSTSPAIVDSDFEIGSLFYATNRYTRGTKSICSVRTYQIAKSGAEILALHNGTDDRTALTQSWKCQDGPGDTNENVTLYDDSGNGNHLTVVGGAVVDQWANRLPGYVRDHAFEYGGRIGTLGEFVPLVPGTALCADGEAATFFPGSIDRNPASRTNFNPGGYADATGLDWETARAQGAERLTIDPDNTKFINVDTGRNAFAVAAPLTGLDLANALIFTTTGGDIGLLKYNNKIILYNDAIIRYDGMVIKLDTAVATEGQLAGIRADLGLTHSRAFMGSYPPGSVVCQVGDSNTDYPGGRPGWHSAVLKEWYATGGFLEGCTDVNLGSNGESLNGWVASIDDATASTTNKGNANVVVNNDPDLVIVSIGTNELWSAARRAGIGVESYMQANFDTLIQFFIDNTNADIWLRMPQPFGMPLVFGDWANADAAAASSEQLRRVHLAWQNRHPRVRLFDSHKALFGYRVDDIETDALDVVTGDAMYYDDLHLNDLGYRRMAQAMADQMAGERRKGLTFVRTPDAILAAARWSIQAFIAAVESASLIDVSTDPMYNAEISLAINQDSLVPLHIQQALIAMRYSQSAVSPVIVIARAGGAANSLKCWCHASGKIVTMTDITVNQLVTATPGSYYYQITANSRSEDFDSGDVGPCTWYVEDLTYAP